MQSRFGKASTIGQQLAFNKERFEVGGVWKMQCTAESGESANAKRRPQ